MEGRERLSLQSLTALKVTKEVIAFHGGASNVPIPPTLVTKHQQAHHNYQKRVEEEGRQNRNKERDKQAEIVASRKRKAEDDEKAKFEEKIKKLESDEKALSDEIKYHKTMLKEQRNTAERSNIKFAELKAIVAAQKNLQELIDKKEKSLREVTANMVKLLKSRKIKK